MHGEPGGLDEIGKPLGVVDPLASVVIEGGRVSVQPDGVGGCQGLGHELEQVWGRVLVEGD